jgi:hypothetical protein
MISCWCIRVIVLRLTICVSWDIFNTYGYQVEENAISRKGAVMKKALMSALCSALIIPGLGQIINQQVKKGLVLLGAVLVLFVMAVIAMHSLLKSGLSENSLVTARPEVIIQKLSNQDFSALWIMLGVFAVVWLYSVLDAFWTGMKGDVSTKQGR